MKLFNKNDIILWISVGLIAILPSLMATLYAFPQADDFGYAELALNHNWLTEYSRLYLEWSGRYTSILLGFLSPLSFGNTSAYSSILFLNILLLITSCSLFFRRLSSAINQPLFGSVFGLLFVGIFLNTISSPGETIYWYSGMITYLTPISLLLLSLYFIIGYLKAKSVIQLIPGILLLFLSLGCNEVQSFAILFCSFLILWLSKKLESSNYSFYSKMFIVVLIGSGLLFCAPGNVVRAGFFTNDNGIISTLIQSEIQVFRFLFTWLGQASVWFLLLISLFVGNYARMHQIKLDVLQGINPLTFLLIPFAILYASILPSYLSMGILGQHRTLTSSLFFFLLWLVLLGIKMGFSANYLSLFLPRLKLFSSAIALVFLGTMLFSGNNNQIVNDVSQGKFESYSEQQNQRFHVIEESKKSVEKKVHFKEIKNFPTSYFHLKIKTDSSHWINQNMARYFDLNHVILEDENCK